MKRWYYITQVVSKKCGKILLWKKKMIVFNNQNFSSVKIVVEADPEPS